jgi:D-lactate dehydrogenase
VDINTGELVKRLRRENHSAAANRRASWVANRFAMVESLVRMGLSVGHGINTVFGKGAMFRLTTGLRGLIPAMPIWSRQMPLAPNLSVLRDSSRYRLPGADQSIVYFPSCISRVMGSYPGRERNLLETFLEVSRRAGIDVRILKDVQGSCCSQVFGSKGFADAQRIMAAAIIDRIWESTDGGKIPVVTDVSSCAYTLQQLRPVLDAERRARFDQLRILDSVDYLHDMVLPRFPLQPSEKRVVLHPVCSLEKMHTREKMVAVARACATEVVIPRQAGCCGMAGDRGFLFPEFTASATAAEASELQGQSCDGYYSTTRSCELAMSEAVQQDYLSILYLVEEGMRAVRDVP